MRKISNFGKTGWMWMQIDDWFSPTTFKGLMLATTFGTILATLFIGFLIRLFSLNLIYLSVIEEEEKNPKTPDQRSNSIHKDRVTIRNEGVPVWIVAEKDDFGLFFTALSNPRKLLTNRTHKVFIQPSKYLKLKRWRGIPFIATRIVKVTSDEVIFHSFGSRVKWLIDSWKENKKHSNDSIAKDFEELLTIRPYCQKFSLRFATPKGTRSKMLSLWTFETGKLSDFSGASSQWHYPEFSMESLSSVVNLHFHVPYSEKEDFSDVELNRHEVKRLIRVLKDKKNFLPPKTPSDFLALYKPKVSPPLVEDVKILPFRTTAIKKIIFSPQLMSSLHKITVESPKRKCDQAGYLFREKDEYLFIGFYDGLLVFGELDDLNYSRISYKQIREFQELLWDWPNW